uniref:Uncharacterized protein n=1 Tax=Schistosoma japonicum TaxID=6182 RepID=Q5C800_SCHJA|nr:unknown [Schistosoma japonicum]
MMALQIRPPPYSAVDYVRQAFPVGNLESTIKGSGNSNTF